MPAITTKRKQRAFRPSIVEVLEGRVVLSSFYVSPSGSSSGDGSINRPWDLRTALDHPAAVKPGDTIWLRGGTYTGTFTSDLRGTAQNPIIVRQYPGERATLDGGSRTGSVLEVQGSDAWFWGFEITCTGSKRVYSETGHHPAGERATGVTVFGPRTKLINLVIHDTGQGIGSWSTASDSEIYGSLVYYNGWQGPDRGYGHGMYVQSKSGTRKIHDNIIFDQFSHGLHAYGSATAALNNLDIQGNVLFDNGIPSSDNGKRNLLVGGESGLVVRNLRLTDNYTYFSGTNGDSANIGYNGSVDGGVVRDNVFARGYTALTANRLNNTTVTGNTIYGRTNLSSSLRAGNTIIASSSTPTGVQVFVEPNQYEAGRANVTVYNWDRRSSVAVDLSGVLSVGARYEIRDAQNFYGSPVVTGTYDGSPVSVPMNLTAVSPIIGNAPKRAVHTDNRFNAFVVLTTGTGTTPPPAGDTTAPTVTTRTPAPGATGVATSTAVTAVFSEPIDPATLTTATFTLRGPNGSVAATVSYDATSRTARLTSSAPLAASTTYTAALSTGVKDTAGNALAAPVSWSFTTASAPTPPVTGTVSLWDTSVVPAIAAADDSDPVELGVKFRTDVTGQVTGLRFYKGPGNTGTHTGRLWTASGQLLATATFTNESASGWQTVTFNTPVTITPGTTYIASYHAPRGHYAYSENYFASSGRTNGPLRALRSGEQGGNGVYRYGPAGRFPNQTYRAANYWIDVLFVAGGTTSGTSAAALAAPIDSSRSLSATGGPGALDTGATATTRPGPGELPVVLLGPTDPTVVPSGVTGSANPADRGPAGLFRRHLPFLARRWQA